MTRLDNTKWDYEIGDLVFHNTLGHGIIVNRSTQSFHEMARPKRIVDREVYSVCFGSNERKSTVRGDSLSSAEDKNIIKSVST